MRTRVSSLCTALVLLALAGCTLSPAATSTLPTVATPQAAVPSATAILSTSTPRPPLAGTDPFALISQESMFASLKDLTSIQPYSGWRNSGSEGERQALDYVEQRLAGFPYLTGLGLETERQAFRVFATTELWETRLEVTLGGQSVEVPANGLRGSRDDLTLALRSDSDGVLNDTVRNPVTVEGPIVLIDTAEQVQALQPGDVQGKIVFLDYALIDQTITPASAAMTLASSVVEKGPAGLILVTRFSNQQGQSHGAFVGDNSVLQTVHADPAPPSLYVRLEDLAPAGLASWKDLGRIETARLTWDADVLAPGSSGNVVARIPGTDPSRAVILGAHIDSPNSPGALDDGSGSAILLEVARVLDASRTQPAVDLYLAWFGSEELGLYGSSYFAATHQDLLDRTVAMLQTDMLSRPLDGLSAELALVTWPYSRLGDDSLAWPTYLSQAAERRGIMASPQGIFNPYSDNNSFGGYGLPHADQIYEPRVAATTSIHYASHVHDPYDTVDLAREMGDVLQEMAVVALTAALDTGQDRPDVQIPPPPRGRAVLVASHTEAGSMTPSGLTEFGMTLAMEGLDVDLVPYGQAVTPADLQGANLVVVLPVVDYAPAHETATYDEAWTSEDIAALEGYAAQGGLLVVTNSNRRLGFGNLGLDANEDWSDANALASRFGITYEQGTLSGGSALPQREHPLLERVTSLELSQGDGVPFALVAGTRSQVLAIAGGQAAMALVDYGDGGGQVLVLADVGLLGAGWGEPRNLPFWQNLARYVQ
jgi:hypothetical protein